MAAKQNKASRNSAIHIDGSVSESTIHIGDKIKTGYTSKEVSILITQIKSTFQPKPFDGRCPYKGLDVFDEEDAELFFGREKLVDDLVRRVKDSRTVFVTGPSGSGKSSLVRAGLIHALKQGAIKGSERWLYATMKPGRDPIGELGRVVSSLASSTNPEDEIRAKALKDATIFSRWCEIVLKEGRNKRIVLFIDQFEEVFTQISKEEERIAFLNLLTQAATIKNGRVVILFSMRSDFVSNCATYLQLNALLNQQFVQIGAMQPEELVSAIAQPALRVGLRIDPDLIAQIINEMKGEPGALPLMQFALKDLFDSQQEKSGVPALVLSDYLQRGGIHKALERHADDSFSKLSKNEQELARSIFSGLIEIGRGTQDTKRTALFNELVPANTKVEDVEAIVQKLADARLLTTDEAAGKDTVTISHEKLIDAWPWLKKLVNENRDAITLQNQISSDAKEWEQHNRDVSYLYSGGRLTNVREQFEKQKIRLSHLAQEFIRAGQARQRRAQAFLISAVSVILIASIGASVIFQNQAQANIEIANTSQAASTFAIDQQERAQANANEALARQLAIQAQSKFTANSNQMVSSLLAIQSMKLFPNGDSASFLINNNLSANPISRIPHDNAVNSVAFSPDGKYVVSGSYDNTARVSEASTGKEIAHITHDGIVTSIAFSPDGKYVVSGSNDFTARVWEAGTGKEIAIMLHNAEVISVAFSPDGKYVLSGSTDHTARVWETSTGNEIARTTHDGEVTSIAFSPDGKYALSGSTDHTARVWETSTGNEIARITHDSFVVAVAFSPDGKYALSGSEDATTRVWETSTGNEIARMLHNGPVSSIAFSPDGKYALSGSYDNTARMWETSTGNEIARMIHDGPVSSIAFSRDGIYVLSGSDDFTAIVWEANLGTILQTVQTIHSSNNLVFSPDGKFAFSEDHGRTAFVWEVATGKVINQFIHDGFVNTAAFSLDGKFLVSGSSDPTTDSMGDIHIWEIATGKEITRIMQNSYVNSVAFSPDGKFIVSGSADKTARVWEIATSKEIARVMHDSEVTYVTFSSDGRFVVSGSADKTARAWEANTGKEFARMIHDDSVYSVAFSPNGKFVASGSNDHTARVWEIATGKEMARVTHDFYVNAVIFTPDSRSVISASSINGTIHIWKYLPEDLIAEACSHVTRNFIRAEWAQYIGDALPFQAVCPNLPIEPDTAFPPTATP